MIKFDENNIGNEPIKAGEYEVYPNAFEVGVSQNGNNRIQVNYYIRRDVDQPSTGQEIRYDNFTETENAAWRMNALMHCMKFQNGAEFPDLTAWGKAILCKPVRVVVEMETNDRGKTYPVVKQFKESQHPNFSIDPQHKFGNGGQMNNFAHPVNISENDLPF